MNEIIGLSEALIKSGKLNWHSEPAHWRVTDDRMEVSADAKTDFWQRTHYGFQADNGHFLSAIAEGDFEMQARVHCQFAHQYDQAGLMVRASEDCWLKTSVEYESGQANLLGAVVTNHGYSDWSTRQVNDEFNPYRLRITRRQSDYRVDVYNTAENTWEQIRLCHLFEGDTVQVGVYACSPKEHGFKAIFSDFFIRGL